jgi:hypothetical protein
MLASTTIIIGLSFTGGGYLVWKDGVCSEIRGTDLAKFEPFQSVILDVGVPEGCFKPKKKAIVETRDHQAVVVQILKELRNVLK